MITEEQVLKLGFELKEDFFIGGHADWETISYYVYEVREDDYAVIKFSTDRFDPKDITTSVSFGVGSCGTFDFIRTVDNIEQLTKLMDACFDIKVKTNEQIKKDIDLDQILIRLSMVKKCGTCVRCDEMLEYIIKQLNLLK